MSSEPWTPNAPRQATADRIRDKTPGTPRKDTADRNRDVTASKAPDTPRKDTADRSRKESSLHVEREPSVPLRSTSSQLEAASMWMNRYKVEDKKTKNRFG